MKVKVTLGASLNPDKGSLERDLTLPEDEPATVGTLARLLRIKLTDQEGSLLVLVNGEAVSWNEVGETALNEGDLVTFHRMLAGG